MACKGHVHGVEEPVLFDAYRLHLGAHLGHGGTVEGEDLVCPFHGWHFGRDGRCTNMPYGRRIPPTAHARSGRIRGHSQEVCENTADLGQFRFIHQPHMMKPLSEPKLDGPFFSLPMESDPEALVPELCTEGPITAGTVFCCGPGLTAADITLRGSGLEAIQRLYVTPVDAEHVELGAS